MDGLSNFICAIFNQISYAIIDSGTGFEFIDTSNSVVIIILSLIYIVSIYLICKLVVGCVRWFYRI